MKNQAENDLQLSCVRPEHPVSYVKVGFEYLGFGLFDLQRLDSSRLLCVRGVSNEDDIRCLRRMEYTWSRNELNYCMRTPQNTKTLPIHLVGSSRNIQGIAPRFGLYAPYDRQFVDGSLKRVYTRH